MNLNKKAILGLVVAGAAFHAAAANINARTSTDLNQGWLFSFGLADPVKTELDASQWQKVSLPHTWNRIGGHAVKAADANDARGVGWYRLDFNAPESTAKPRRSWLQFDGASIATEVWLNGVSVGKHRNGVSGFRFDVTDAIQPGRNLLVVKTDNTAPEAPNSSTAEILPMAGDWFMYGGLYRKVSLITTDSLHIDLADHGGPGIYVSTPIVTDKEAKVDVVAKVRNDTPNRTRPMVRTILLDAQGKVVASEIKALALAGQTSGESRSTLRVSKPRLWNGVQDPYLYQVRVEVMAGKRVVDAVTQNVGIRTIRFDPSHGFFLNGKKLALHGVNRHQEAGADGWAVSDEALQRDYALIKELGANTVRLAHYQHAQAEYDMADRAGLLVWAEVPLVTLSAPYGKQEATASFAQNAEEHLRALVRQNFNHPSIASWSIANEPNLAAMWLPKAPSTLPLLRRLAALAHEEDPSRPPVLASCCGTIPGELSPGATKEGLDSPPAAVGVFGVNTYFGWYYGTPADAGAYWDRVHALYPDKALSVTEYGAGGALTQHSDNVLGGPINATGRPHPEEYQSYVHEKTWPQLRDRGYLWGTWLWNMFDFSSPSRQEGDLVDTNNKGIVSFDRSVRKESFYFYKAHWNPEPMLYLAGHRYTERASPLADIKAYSNAAQASLTINGQDQGSVPCVERICTWRAVGLTQGANKVEVVATAGGKQLKDSAVWHRAHGADTYHILAGQLAVTDTSIGRFGSDNFFTGGDGELLNKASFTKVAVKMVKAAADQRLYQAYRRGTFSYDLALPDGSYRATLRFMEPNAGATAGQRVFDVKLQDKVVLENVDIAAAVGVLTAYEKTVPFSVSGGVAHIAFTPKAGAAILSSLSIEPLK